MNLLYSLLSALSASLPASTQQVTVCVEPAMSIPELAPAAEVPIVVDLPAGAVVDTVSVSLTLTHSWVGDLTINLNKDEATAVLLDRLSIGTLPFGCGGKNIDAIFTDLATTTAESLCQPGITPVVFGDVLPQTPLSTFTERAAGGIWTISVADEAAFDLGQIDRVCLTVHYTNPASPCSPADLAEPFGTLDANDTIAFLNLFESQNPLADIAAPLDEHDFFDVLTHLVQIDEGCP